MSPIVQYVLCGFCGGALYVMVSALIVLDRIAVALKAIAKNPAQRRPEETS